MIFGFLFCGFGMMFGTHRGFSKGVCTISVNPDGLMKLVFWESFEVEK